MKVSERLAREIKSETASIWYVTDGSSNKIILKLPSSSIKNVINGCQVQFLFGVDVRGDRRHFHTGVKVHDDADHPLLTIGAERYYDEHESLKSVISRGESLVEFYNELNVCVASSHVTFTKNDVDNILMLHGDIQSLYVGDFNSNVDSSLDCFDYTLDRTKKLFDAYEITVILALVTFSDFQINELNFIGFNSITRVSIDDTDEGGTQERQILAALEKMFHGTIHLNSMVNHPTHQNELTDILAYYQEGMFFIESKALTILSAAHDKTMTRKVATLKKHIKKAIGQLTGAKKSIERDYEILDKEGETINIPSAIRPQHILPHCIVLISELLYFGDWSDIESLLKKTMISENAYFHVIDFVEFINILKLSQGNKRLFDYNLIQRFEKFVETESIFIISKIANN